MAGISPEQFGGNALGSVPEVKTLFDEIKTLRDVTDDFVHTTKMLQGDAIKSMARFNKQPNAAFNRRVLIKTIFSWIEGQTYQMKRVALHRHAHLHIDFSRAEIALLREDKYFLDDKGDAHETPNNFQRFIQNYQFALKAFAKAHAASFTFDRSKLPDLRKLEDVRNRLTHPKKSKDLDVSDEEIKLAEVVLNSHIRVSADVVGEALKENPQTVKIAEFTRELPFHATMPIVVLWADGTVLEFPTKAAARAFTKSVGAKKSRLDFTSYCFLDMPE